MFLLILRDLQYRRWIVGLTILLMAIVMTLLFIMSGLVNQFNTEPGLATQRAGGDRNWIVAQGTGGPFTSPRPIDAEMFTSVPGDDVLVTMGSLDGLRVSIVGRNYDRATEPVLTTGTYPLQPGDIVIDESAGYQVGDPVLFGRAPGRVVGLTSDATVLAGVPIVFVELGFHQDIALGGRNLILARLTDQIPERLPPELKLMTPDEVAEDTLLPLDGAIASVTLVQVLLWLITIIIIAAIIYISALERTRDFAVLKAVGGKNRDLGLSLLVQGVVMTLLAVAVAGVLQMFLAPSFPLKVRVASSAWFTIGAGAVAAALAAGLAGVMKVRATAPAEAFG